MYYKSIISNLFTKISITLFYLYNNVGINLYDSIYIQILIYITYICYLYLIQLVK